jgi:hypothetical protein
MLAQAVKVNVLDDDHLVIVYVKECIVDEADRLDIVASSQFVIHSGDPLWSPSQTFPVRVFADVIQDFSDSGFDPGSVCFGYRAAFAHRDFKCFL